MPVSNIKLLENLIDYCSLKNKVISKNIANIGTNDYKREDVKFKNFLNDASSHLKATNEKHFGAENVDQALQYDVVTDNNKENVSGINNVDIDKEMAELAENSIRFKFAAKKINGHYTNLQNVIKGGSIL